MMYAQYTTLTMRTSGQAEALDPNLTVYETLEQAAPEAKMNEVKALLGRMMFSGTSMGKKARAAFPLFWPTLLHQGKRPQALQCSFI